MVNTDLLIDGDAIVSNADIIDRACVSRVVRARGVKSPNDMIKQSDLIVNGDVTEVRSSSSSVAELLEQQKVDSTLKECWDSVDNPKTGFFTRNTDSLLFHRKPISGVVLERLVSTRV